MENYLQTKKGYGLLSSLKFNLEMAPSIKEVLEKDGSGTLRIPEFPGLEQWRGQVANFGTAIAATRSPFDGLVTIKDRYINLQGSDKSTIRLRIYQPQSTQELPLLYWMHGGGMIGGLPEQDDLQMKEIAIKANCTVISIDYRVAPEYPYPVPLKDCYEGLMWIVEHSKTLGIDAKKIAVGGASAGAGLAAALTLKIKKYGGPVLVHQSLLYPMLDHKNKTNSSQQITNLGLWDRSFNLIGWEAYLGKNHLDVKAPEFASPVHTEDLYALPDTFIAVGSLDLFRDEDIEFALRLMEAGVKVDLQFYPGATHGFDVLIPNDPMSVSLTTKRIQALKLAFGEF
ncbi:alpha/beta hydrolase [Chryseobacterium sp. M5A1_1a]